MDEVFVADDELYKDRDLSWLDFNMRILDQTRQGCVPLFERLKFLSITASNFDEFYMVRIGKRYNHNTYNQQLKFKINTYLRSSTYAYNQLINLINKQAGITICRNCGEIEDNGRKSVRNYFIETILQLYVQNKDMFVQNISHIEEKKIYMLVYADKNAFIIRIPDVLPRLFEYDKNKYILIEDIITFYVQLILPDCDSYKTFCFRVLKNGQMEDSSLSGQELYNHVKNQLSLRKKSDNILLELPKGIPAFYESYLLKALKVNKDNVHKYNRPLDLTFLMELYKKEEYNFFKYKRFLPRNRFSDYNSMFNKLEEKDYLLSHPYDSFLPVLKLLEIAALDDAVTKIWLTLYRVSNNSPIIKFLCLAAKNGKEVNVVLEIKARFDEENNMKWYHVLKQGGCNVIFGYPGHKTHSKIMLIQKNVENDERLYAHLGTGNYNDTTAKQYTDNGLLTCDREITGECKKLFEMLYNGDIYDEFDNLIVAPVNIKSKLFHLIDEQIECAVRGEQGHIIAKMNGLTDKDMINKLYEASKKGVRIELIVRGVCCLRTGIVGISDNISVRSIVGKYLEHSRVFYFAGRDIKASKIYMGSADLMTRNLERRVEVLFPIKECSIKESIKKELDILLKDNVGAYILNKEGVYKKVKTGKRAISAQEYFQNNKRIED